jgi:UDP-N-acetylmuramate dehydrogenase
MPADRDDLATFLRQLPASEPVTVLGLGSNTLVRDGGVRGTVVVMHNPAPRSRSRTAHLRGSRCSEPEARALRRDARMRRGGVPRGRARARRRRARDERRAATAERRGATSRASKCLTRSGQFEVRTPIDYDDRLPHVSPGRWNLHLGVVPFSAGRRQPPRGADQGAPGTAHRHAAAVAAERGQRVPQPAGDHAARLVEFCGLKGFAIGDARVSRCTPISS